MFEDVAIIHDGTASIPSFIPHFSKILRHLNVNMLIQWNPNSSERMHYEISSNGTHMKRVKSNGWDIVLKSYTFK